MKRKSSLSVGERKELSKKLSSMHSLYFVGIGGSGMYGCARLALDLGFRVSGFDAVESRNTERLLKAGIPVSFKALSLPQSTDAVIYTLAVSEEHPLIKAARARGILTVSRNDFLGAMIERFPTRIAIAGSHGKSSTVGMCAEILTRAGLSPTVIVGADLSAEEGGYRRGRGESVLIEACEYRDAFLSLSPTHAAVLNAEWEHTDYFRSEAEVRRSFSRFLNTESVLCRIANQSTHMEADLLFGAKEGIHAEGVTLEEGFSHFAVMDGKRKLGEISLGVLGKHQVENALAAFSVARALGIKDEVIFSALSAFRGVGGRMERVGTLLGAPLYLDYAHHPTELSAALRSARSLGGRVVCVFEPHTFSRVHAFYAAFAELLSFSSPDKAGILPIYPAREINTYGVSSEKLALDCGAVFLKSFKDAADFLRENAGEDTVLLLLGAGRVREVLRFTE